jgi:arginine decarboxylase
LASTYYGNFSIFQSIPDSWAIDQVFPIVPLHRLNEKPTQSATIADLTCDSDGKIDRFIGPDGRIAPVLPLHEPGDRPYWLGIFLTGSYQEILGDLHNLFGDTTAVHVRLGEGGEVLTEVIPGDSVADVLGYVQYDRDRLLASIRQRCTVAIRQQQITPAEACSLEAHIETSLKASTYLQGEAVGWQSESTADVPESETFDFACANNS